MIPDFETIEDLARRTRTERSLLIAELIASSVMALDVAVRAAWTRGVALLRSRPAVPRQAAAARR